MNTLDLVEAVQRSAGRELVTEDGDREVVGLQPPASQARILEVEAELGHPLPAPLRALVERTAGLELLESVDFLSAGRSPLDALFGNVLTLAGDGAGNFWILELDPQHATLGPVWFVCHDAPVLVYQSPDLASFVEDYLRFKSAPHDGPVADVVRGAVRRVAGQRVEVPAASLVDSDDPLLRTFARSLDGEWYVRDLRAARCGDGMPLGRYGPSTPLARAGREFVFAYGTCSRVQRLRTFLLGR